MITSSSPLAWIAAASASGRRGCGRGKCQVETSSYDGDESLQSTVYGENLADPRGGRCDFLEMLEIVIKGQSMKGRVDGCK